MNLISQYLYKNCARTSLAVFLILFLILLANTGLRLVEDVNNGDIASIFLIKLLVLKMVQYSPLIISLGLFFGIIISLNRLYTSNEMTIMQLNGISNFELAKILTKLILIFIIVMSLLELILSPKAFELRTQVQHQITHEQKIYTLNEGSFNISNDGSRVVYITQKNSTKPGNIFIKSTSNLTTRIDISSRIKSSDDKKIILEDGKAYSFDSDGSFSSTDYESQNMLITNTMPKLNNNNLQSKSIFELFQSINLSELAEILNRFSVIISGIILAYIAIPLSSLFRRNEKYKNVFIGAILYFSYIVLMNIMSQSFNTEISLLISTFITHAFFIFIAYCLYASKSR
ncbi:MAG: LptF/LptG family permease [Gammaproteobacteria bacterium]